MSLAFSFFLNSLHKLATYLNLALDQKIGQKSHNQHISRQKTLDCLP